MFKHEEFYKNGYAILKFDPCGINEVLASITNGKLKTGFSLNAKYSNTADLRPNVIDYDKCFMDALKINEIAKTIEESTLRNLTLYHVQVRLAKSETSYMNWHRDTYVDGKRNIGMMPPGVKLIYYPAFEQESKGRLKIAEGSHRCMLDDVKKDSENISNFKQIEIATNNSTAILFDTSCLHAVIPDERNSISVRVIYSFVSPYQITNDELHVRTSKMYEVLK